MRLFLARPLAKNDRKSLSATETKYSVLSTPPSFRLGFPKRRTGLSGVRSYDSQTCSVQLGIFASVDAGARLDHRTDEADGHLADFRSLLKKLAELGFRQILAVVGGAKMRSGFVEAAERIAEKQDELALRAAAEPWRCLP